MSSHDPALEETGHPTPEQAGADLDRLAPEVAAIVRRLARREARARRAAERARDEAIRARRELDELNRIGMALMTERDPDRLLARILERARRLTDSDAGSLYLVERTRDGRRLRFKLSQNDSLPGLELAEFTLPLDTTSLAGYAAATREPLVVDDAYRIPADAPFRQNRSFDERFGYHTRSLLVVPMVDHRDELVGVVQLINRVPERDGPISDALAADRAVVPFGEREVQLVRSLAGQAAVSIENSHLYREIENIFETFVKASVTAIDQRDPTTAGHSVRVATLTCDLAGALERVEVGRWAGQRFTREQMRELRYAALLHDFGKVAVREEVLVKAQKLSPLMTARVEGRCGLIRRTLEAEYHRARAEELERRGPRGYRVVAGRLEAAYRERLAELDRFEAAVRRANQPTILPESTAQALAEWAQRTYRGLDDEPAPYLSAEELSFLSIPKGSLDERERREIESHAEQTYRFLSQIPWTDDLAGVAEIAYGHHEKLDGRGYPRGKAGEEIPVQTRIMTIADIFDALTASDRPYKHAVPVEKALDIISAEAGAGQLDADLVRVLIDSQLYRRVLAGDWRDL